MAKENAITQIRIITNMFQVDGSLTLIDGTTYEDAVAHLPEFVTLTTARFHDIRTQAFLFESKRVVINRGHIHAVVRIEDIGDDVGDGLPAAPTWQPQVEGVVVSDLMTQKVLTIRINDDVQEAFRLMAANRIRHLPVVENNQLVGMVSDRDLRIFLLSGKAMPVEEIMVQFVRLKTVDPSTTVMRACELMVGSRISCLPVVQDTRLKGILTETDMLKFLQKLISGKK